MNSVITVRGNTRKARKKRVSNAGIWQSFTIFTRSFAGAGALVAVYPEAWVGAPAQSRGAGDRYRMLGIEGS